MSYIYSKNNFKIAENPEVLAQQFTQWLAAAVAEALTTKSQFHIAVPGGTTPGVLFRTLAGPAGDALPWDALHWWWTDERAVPPGDTRSNYGLTFKELLQKRQVSEPNIHRIKGEIKPQVAGQLYGIEMEECLGRHASGIPFFDLVVLGMGTDGHVASLFPDKTHEEPHPWVSTVQHEGVNRVSLSYEVILASTRIAFLVTGANKADVLQNIVNKTETGAKLPGGIVWAKRPDSFWFVDEPAAEILKRG